MSNDLPGRCSLFTPHVPRLRRCLSDRWHRVYCRECKAEFTKRWEKAGHDVEVGLRMLPTIEVAKDRSNEVWSALQVEMRKAQNSSVKHKPAQPIPAWSPSPKFTAHLCHLLHTAVVGLKVSFVTPRVAKIWVCLAATLLFNSFYIGEKVVRYGSIIAKAEEVHLTDMPIFFDGVNRSTVSSRWGTINRKPDKVRNQRKRRPRKSHKRR